MAGDLESVEVYPSSYTIITPVATTYHCVASRCESVDRLQGMVVENEAFEFIVEPWNSYEVSYLRLT